MTRKQRLVLSLTMAALALPSACATPPPEPDAARPVAVPNAQVPPEVMLVEPARARPGQIVAVTFTAATARGFLYAIERETEFGWQHLHYMLATTNGDEPMWFEAGEDPIIGPVGNEGLGPDRIPIPDVLPQGDYRICTARTRDSTCAPIEVVFP